MRCSKATLVQLSHALENLVLSRHVPAMVFTGFQESGYWQPASKRYQALAQVVRQLCIFAGGPLPPENNLTSLHITLANDDPLRQEWFMVILSESISIVLIGQVDRNTVNHKTARLFEVIWRFEPDIVNLALDLLEDVIARYRPERLLAIQTIRANYPPPQLDAALVTMLTMEMIRAEEKLYQELRPMVQTLQQTTSAMGQREVQLRRAEAKYRQLVEQTPAIIYVRAFDEARSITYISPQVETILGYTPAEIKANPELWRQLRHPDDRALVEINFSNATGSSLSCEYRLLTRAGRVVWVSDEAMLVRNDEGRPLFSQGILFDISARKQVEEALAAERERLDVTLQSIGDGVIAADAEGRIVLANPIAQTYLKILVDADPGDPLTHLGGHPLQEFLAPLPQGETYREVVIESLPRQIFEVIAHPMETGSQAGGWVLVVRDVTQERTAQERIRQQDRLAAVGQLAAGIAHDFNNTLTSIIGFAELARTQPGASPAIQTDMERIIQQGRRAAYLIRQILDFTRQSISEKRPLDLVLFVKETIKLLERTIPENISIVLNIEPGEQSYRLNADLIQMRQAVTNLAINARDAMTKGGVLRFQISRFTLVPGESPPHPDLSPGDWITLSISDTGPGIPAELRPHIFEPFFTTKKVGESAGLGLAQVYGIVKQHEGHIDVQSQNGAGATFTLYLPALAGSTPLKHPTTPAELPPGKGEVILLVEDSPMVREVTKVILKRLGYQVLTAANGRDALRVYEQHRAEIALVLTDVTMPEMSGIALAQALRDQDPDLKVIALTGYPLEHQDKELLAQGIVAWLQKPLDDMSQLGRIIHEVLKPD